MRVFAHITKDLRVVTKITFPRLAFRYKISYLK
jgi:hypothetical protein